MAVPPLVAQGIIESYTFPSSADMGVQASWSIVAHNIGSDGRFAAGIVNVAGNPGDMTIIWMGKETIIPPGTYFRINSVNPEPNCKRITVNGEVKFAVAGNYAIKLWAMHEGSPDQWIYDDERTLTVNVAEVTLPEWPVVKTDHVFDNVRLDPGILFEARQSQEKQVDTSLALGGQIEYSIKLESSLTTACTYYIMWNNEILLEEGFAPWVPHGTIRTGVLNLPLSKIRSTNVLTIVLSHVPLTFNRVLFNVFVTIGYSNEPTVDPPWEEEDWLDWLMRNAWWITLGTAGTILTGAIVLGYVTELGEKK